MAKDYYQILGVERSASADDIKKAYRKLSKELHPDKHKGDKDVENRFKEVNQAYEVLKDPKKKQQYDQFGTTGGPGGGGFGGFDFSGFQQGDMGGFGDIFENFFGGGGARRGGGRKKGEDIEVEIAVEFAEAVSGMQREFTIEKMVNCVDCDGAGMQKGSKMSKCSECNGTGQVTRTQQSFFGAIRQSFVCPICSGSGEVPDDPCKKCHGEGRRQERANIKVEIPAGVHDGQTLRIREQGNAGRRGEPAGDLFVHVRVREDKHFARNGDDIHTTVTVSAIDATLGTKVSVKTVHGNVSLTIPEGTQPNQVMRIKGKGMPIVGTSRTGDHYVTVQVEIPKKLSKKERKLLEELRSS